MRNHEKYTSSIIQGKVQGKKVSEKEDFMT